MPESEAGQHHEAEILAGRKDSVISHEQFSKAPDEKNYSPRSVVKAPLGS
jgi:hypothetical protein